MRFRILSFFSRVIRAMNESPVDSLYPVGVRGMKILDRSKFTREVEVPILKVRESQLSAVTKPCKKYFLKLENFKPIQVINNQPITSTETTKCIFLNPTKVKSWQDILEEDRFRLVDSGLNETCFGLKKIQLTYENWPSDYIFKAVLPLEEDMVSGFSQIGHIVHLNLRDHLLEYKSLIGEVLLDKIKICKTVVNKSNIIDNTYRNFVMEVIAGEDDYNVKVKESNCIFEFDFSKVYWNPRLSKEHERIITILKPGDVLFDVFCGVGPFAIPVAKKKYFVYANDLNPESYKWLNHNAKINKIKHEFFNSYNLDGKDFICNIFKNYLVDLLEGRKHIDANATIHITMNLPALAVEFLQHFNSLLKDIKTVIELNINVHVYTFTVGDNPEEKAKVLVKENLSFDISSNIIEVFNVRNVSPKKEMMRVSFNLPLNVLLGNNHKRSAGDSDNAYKKLCSSAIK